MQTKQKLNIYVCILATNTLAIVRKAVTFKYQSYTTNFLTYFNQLFNIYHFVTNI